MYIWLENSEPGFNRNSKVQQDFMKNYADDENDNSVEMSWLVDSCPACPIDNCSENYIEDFGENYIEDLAGE